MESKNIIIVLLIALTLGVLFAGCSKSVDEVKSDVSPVVGQDTGSDIPVVEEIDSSVDGTEVNNVVNDDLDKDVEIGSLI